MKTIGMIGGMSWLSTVEYYSYINQYIANKLGGLHSAQIILSSIDFYKIEGLQKSSQWEKAGEYILSEAQKLEKIGVDFVVICSVTGNECVDRIQPYIQIPILHIADSFGKYIHMRGIQNVALLGTIYTMEKKYIKRKLEQYQLNVVIPESKDRTRINNIIYYELCLGIKKQEAKQDVIAIIERLVHEHQVQAVILGCTELPLLLQSNDIAIPLLNSTKIHATFAAEKALETL